MLVLFVSPLLSCGAKKQSTNQLHFVPYANDHDFALETTTGTLCKTWDWQHTPKEPIDNIPVCYMMGHYGQ